MGIGFPFQENAMGLAAVRNPIRDLKENYSYREKPLRMCDLGIFNHA